MRLSRAESGAIGSSGSASESTSRPSSLQLQAAELDALVGHHRAGDRHRRLRRQRRDRLVELARLLLLGEHHLREARFVADDHELHALLVAHGVHPAADPHLLADLAGQLLDQCSLTLGPYPSGRCQGFWVAGAASPALPAPARPRPRTPRPALSRAARSTRPAAGRPLRAPAPAAARRCRAPPPAATGARIGRCAWDFALRTSRSTSAVTSSATSSRASGAAPPPRQLSSPQATAHGAPSPPATTTTPPRRRTAGTARTGAGRPTARCAARG